MAGSWWRTLALSLASPGTQGSWQRRYAEGLNVAPSGGSWPREVVEDAPPAETVDKGGWARRLGGSGARGGWARRLAETAAGYLGELGGDSEVASEADEVVVIPIEPPTAPGAAEPTPVYVTALRIRIAENHSGGNRNLKPVIYKNDNTKVVAGQELVVTASMAGTTQDLLLTTPAYLDAGTWYIGVLADGTVTFLAAADGESLVADNTYSDGPAATLGATTPRNGKLAVSAVYQVAAPATAALAISGSPPTTATQDEAYDGFTPTVAGGYAPYAFSIAAGELPAGLSINAATGEISGTPSAAGTESGIVVRVTDARAQTDDLASFDLEVGTAGYGSHRYWRLSISANSGHSTSTGICELEFRSTVGGDDLTGSGTALSGGDGADGGGNEATKAFDGVTGANGWARSSTTDTWIGYDFGSAVSVAEIAVTTQTGSNYNLAPSAFTLDWSDDGSDWTVADTFTVYGWLSGQQRVIPEEAPAAGLHRHWRLFCQDNNGGTSLIIVDNFEVRATVGGADQTPDLTTNLGDTTGRAIRSSEAGGNEAFHAFDNGNTPWAGVGTTDQWVGFVFPAPVACLQVAIKGGSGSPSSTLTRSPNNVHVDYSDDGANWTNVTGTVALGTWTGGQTKTIDL